MKLIEAEYTTSGMNNKQFGAYATTKLNLGKTIHDHTIKQRLSSMGIPPNYLRAVPRPIDEQTAMLMKHEAQILDLQERMTVMESWIKTMFPTKGPNKAFGE